MALPQANSVLPDGRLIPLGADVCRNLHRAASKAPSGSGMCDRAGHGSTHGSLTSRFLGTAAARWPGSGGTVNHQQRSRARIVADLLGLVVAMAVAVVFSVALATSGGGTPPTAVDARGSHLIP